MARWTAVTAFLLLAIPALAQEPATGQGVDWTVKVIRLEYAEATEVAALLSEILPASVRVVPYPRTNSIVISGPARVLSSLEKRVE